MLARAKKERVVIEGQIAEAFSDIFSGQFKSLADIFYRFLAIDEASLERQINYKLYMEYAFEKECENNPNRFSDTGSGAKKYLHTYTWLRRWAYLSLSIFFHRISLKEKKNLSLVLYEEWKVTSNDCNNAYNRFYRHLADEFKEKGFVFNGYSLFKFQTKQRELLRSVIRHPIQIMLAMASGLAMLLALESILHRKDVLKKQYVDYLCYKCLKTTRRFYALSVCSVFVTANYRSYQAVDKKIANNFGVKLVIIQNAPYVEIGRERYAFPSANIFLGWTKIERDVIPGGIECELFLATGSLNMKMDELFPSYRFRTKHWDFLLIEQNVYPEQGVGGDRRHHKKMLKNFCLFAEENARFKCAYLCRYPREESIIGPDFASLLQWDDWRLRQADIEILPRGAGLAAKAVKSSDVIITLNSSVRVEALLMGKAAISLNYSCSDNDIFQLLFDYPLVIQDSSYNRLKEALLYCVTEDVNIIFRDTVEKSGFTRALDLQFAEKTVEHLCCGWAPDV